MFYNGEITVSFIPRDKFMHFDYTEVPFYISKEIKELYAFIPLLGK